MVSLLRRINKERVIVGIELDISECLSVYTFDSGRTIYSWEDHPNCKGYNLASILYQKIYPLAYGWSAKKHLMDLSASGQLTEDHVYVEPFKLLLYAANVVQSEGSNVFGTVPPGMKAIHMITDYLSFLKKQIIKRLRSIDYTLANEHIQWSLAIPDQWTDLMKSQIRVAALRAGFARKNDLKNLVVCTRSEAAALMACRDPNLKVQDPVENFTILVLDAGKDIVSVSVHNLKNKAGETVPSEATHIVGALLGSKSADDSFELMFRQKLELADSVYLEWSKSHSHEHAWLMRQWESPKYLSLSAESLASPEVHVWPSDHFKFIIPLQLKQSIADDVLCDLGHYTDNAQMLILTSSDLKNVYQDVVPKVVRMVEGQVARRLGGKVADALFMVGSFSTCPYLQQEVKKSMKNKVRQVIVPASPSATVLEGAVMFACHPDLIPLPSNRPTNVGGVQKDRAERNNPSLVGGSLHPEKKIWDAQKGFEIFVTRGDMVGAEESIQQSHSSLAKDTGLLGIYVHGTEELDPKYVDESESSMKKIASMTLPVCPLTSAGSEEEGPRKIKVTFCLGRSEIKVEAEGVETGKKVDCSMNFTQLF